METKKRFRTPYLLANNVVGRALSQAYPRQALSGPAADSEAERDSYPPLRYRPVNSARFTPMRAWPRAPFATCSKRPLSILLLAWGTWVGTGPVNRGWLALLTAGEG